MPAWSGGTTQASTLVLTPKSTPPAGGWPVIAWAHGTTTAAYKSCAPSDTLDHLDGGLTAQGFASHYAEVLGYFVDAGYAVVAPDFEGLGSAATVPYPYFQAASESRSLIAAVKAARLANAALSTKWMAIGHSKGGRGVLVVQGYLGEASELDFRGSVAYAPFTSLAPMLDLLETMKTSDPANAQLYRGVQNNQVAVMVVGLKTVNPGADMTALMGADLLAALPNYSSQCIFGAFQILAGAVGANPAFAGFKSNWSSAPAMQTSCNRTIRRRCPVSS